MPEPFTTGTGLVLGVASGILTAGILVGLDSGTTISAFAGAVVFVLSAVDFAIPKRLLLFITSFALGLVASEFTSSVLALILSAVLQGQIQVDRPIGAAVAAAASVRVLMMFTAKSKQVSLLDRFKGGDQ